MYYVYMLTNYNNTVLYTGVTRDLKCRLWQHANKTNSNCFTAKYNCYKLVFFEATENINAAIAREKQVKGWTRKKKDILVESMNPSWQDLGVELALR